MVATADGLDALLHALTELIKDILEIVRLIMSLAGG